MAASELTYSMEETVIAQMALRRAAGAAVTTLELPRFIDAICGEIDMLRNAGFDDEEIAAIVERAIGRTITPEIIAQCRPSEGLSQTNSVPASA